MGHIFLLYPYDGFFLNFVIPMGLFLLHTIGIYMGPWSAHPHPLSVDGDEEGNEIG